MTPMFDICSMIVPAATLATVTVFETSCKRLRELDWRIILSEKYAPYENSVDQERIFLRILN
jgi:hypothetical protein